MTQPNNPENAALPEKLTRSQQRMKARSENKGKKKAEGQEAAPNIFVRGYNFLLEARQELGRVTWPTRSETIKSTGVLLVLVCVAGIYLGLVDGILTRLMKFVLG